MFYKGMQKTLLSIIVLAFSCIALTACQEESSVNNDASQTIERKRAEEVLYDIYDSPEEFESTNMERWFFLDSGEAVFRMKTVGGKKEYRSCIIQPDGSWKSKRASWSNNYIKKAKGTMSCLISDSKGILYAIASKKNSYDRKLYRIDSTSNQIEELTIKKIKGKVLDCIELIDDNTLVLMYAKKKDIDRHIIGTVTTYEYNLAEEKVVSPKGKMMNCSVELDEHGIYYYVSPEQKLIIGKNLYSSTTERAIKCNTDLFSASHVLIKDGFGYIMTDKGIYGGKLDVEEWKLLIPVEEMYIPKDLNRPEEGIFPASAIMSMVKVPGDDKEIFCVTLADGKNPKFKWVHYYEK